MANSRIRYARDGQIRSAISSRAIKFCTEAPDICKLAVWNFVICQLPGILKCLVDFWKMFARLRWTDHLVWVVGVRRTCGCVTFPLGGGIRLRDADGVIFNNVLLVKFSQSPLIISVESRRCVLNRHVHQKFNIRIAGFLSCLPKHVIEGKIEATGRRGRSRKQLLDDLK